MGALLTVYTLSVYTAINSHSTFTISMDTHRIRSEAADDSFFAGQYLLFDRTRPALPVLCGDQSGRDGHFGEYPVVRMVGVVLFHGVQNRFIEGAMLLLHSGRGQTIGGGARVGTGGR